LEASYIVFQLPPFHANISKRLTKAHKIYFYDIGLVCNLLRIQRPELLESHPLRGAIFENLIVADIVKSRRHEGLMDNFFFYRDSNQNEIDLVIDDLQTLDAVEIKSTETFHKSLLKGLDHFRKVFPEKARRTILCSASTHEMPIKEHQLVHLRNISEVINHG
jgi:predicted AAA+ superfamily ATPase